MPPRLFEHLKPGGVLVIQVGKTQAEQSPLAITKDAKGGRATRDQDPVRFGPFRRASDSKGK